MGLKVEIPGSSSRERDISNFHPYILGLYIKIKNIEDRTKYQFSNSRERDTLTTTKNAYPYILFIEI